MCGIGVLFQEENTQLDTTNISGDFKALIDKILSQTVSEKSIQVYTNVA